MGMAPPYSWMITTVGSFYGEDAGAVQSHHGRSRSTTRHVPQSEYGPDATPFLRDQVRRELSSRESEP